MKSYSKGEIIMKTTVELYEEHEEMLVKQYNQLMNKIRIITADDETSNDVDLMMFIKELMDYASYLTLLIKTVRYEIKKLDQKRIEEA